MGTSKGDKVFTVINYTFLILLAISTLYPFLYVFAASLSSSEAVMTGRVWLYPLDFTLDSYKKVMEQDGLWVAYGNTIFYTLVGTAANLIMITLGAYPLSKKRLMGRTPINFFITVSMIFPAGMIPLYLTIRDLHLLDTRTAIIIAFAVNTFYVFILRSFFQAIPEEMEEAAKMDGAGDLRILWKIFLPLAMPAYAALGLFFAVSRWNGFLWSMIILKDDDKIPLQVLLNSVIVQMDANSELIQSAQDPGMPFSVETVVYATIMVATIPILMVYPFIQRFFVKGVMIGSVKG